jgi:hypothetical protein
MSMVDKLYQTVLITVLVTLSFCGDADDDRVYIHIPGY